MPIYIAIINNTKIECFNDFCLSSLGNHCSGESGLNTIYMSNNMVTYRERIVSLRQWKKTKISPVVSKYIHMMYCCLVLFECIIHVYSCISRWNIDKNIHNIILIARYVGTVYNRVPTWVLYFSVE